MNLPFWILCELQLHYFISTTLTKSNMSQSMTTVFIWFPNKTTLLQYLSILLKVISHCASVLTLTAPQDRSATVSSFIWNMSFHDENSWASRKFTNSSIQSTDRECTYRPAADRQRSDDSRTRGLAEIIQRTREECCTKTQVKSEKTDWKLT